MNDHTHEALEENEHDEVASPKASKEHQELVDNGNFDALPNKIPSDESHGFDHGEMVVYRDDGRVYHVAEVHTYGIVNKIERVIRPYDPEAVDIWSVKDVDGEKVATPRQRVPRNDVRPLIEYGQMTFGLQHPDLAAKGARIGIDPVKGHGRVVMPDDGRSDPKEAVYIGPPPPAQLN